MSGAAALSGLGALRGGAGLVYIAIPAAIAEIVAASEPSYLTLPLPSDDAGRFAEDALSPISSALAGKDAAAIGPGLGRSPALEAIVGTLYRDCELPLVVDADALNALAASGADLGDHAGPRILTPHPGEFTRLSGTSIDADRSESAKRFAAAHSVVLVLKGAGTVATDGEDVWINSTGNSGMATGGTGDVLTGLLAALLAQGMSPLDAAKLGVHLHGLAGDLAAQDLSQPGLIASDLPRYLPAAWKAMAGDT